MLKRAEQQTKGKAEMYETSSNINRNNANKVIQRTNSENNSRDLALGNFIGEMVGLENISEGV